MVRPADHEIQSKEPRQIVTLPFRISNGTGEKRLLEARPIFPPNWRLMTPEFPFELEAGETTVRFVNVFIPEGTPAGEYHLTYEVHDRRAPAIRDAYTISVRVLPMLKLQVDPLEVPQFVISGDHYEAIFLIQNNGNAPLTVEYAVNHSHSAPLEPNTGTLTLAPGESKPVTVKVKTNTLHQPEQDWLTLKARVQNQEIAENIVRKVKVLPRVSGYEQRYHTLPAALSLRGVMQDKNNERRFGWQTELAGGGVIDASGQRYIDFLFRGPDLREEAIFGAMDEYRVNYQDEHLALSLGDRVYTLSPLIEYGRYGRGVGAGYHTEDWSVKSYYMQDRFTSDAQEETGFNASYVANQWARLGFNYLNKQGPLAGHTFGLRSQLEWEPGFATDLEYARSQGEGKGNAVRGHLLDSRYPFRYRLTLLHADPGFRGYYRDQQFVFSGFDYPLNNRWNMRGSFQFQRNNLNLDPDRTAPQQWQALFGTDYQLFANTNLILDYRQRGDLDRRTLASFYAQHYSVRAGASQRFGTLTLNTTGEWGETEDDLHQEHFDTTLYTVSAGWQASERQSYSAYFFYDDNTYSNVQQGVQSTLGFNANYQLFRSSLLSLNIQSNRSQGDSHYNFNAAFVQQLSNGHQASLAARRSTGTLEQTNIMLTYTVPFNLPIGRKKGVATLRGRVFDEETKEGVPDVVLNLNGLIAVSGEDGHFTFPSVKNGIYYLSLERANRVFNKIALYELPMEVHIQAGAANEVAIPLIRGVTLEGQIRVFGSANQKLPSQNYRLQPVGIRSPNDVEDKSSVQQLMPSYGLQNTLVVLHNSKRIYKRLTDDKGRFRIAGVLPGKWTVTVLEEGLPVNYELEKKEWVLDVKPGEKARVEFKLLPKIRKIKMLEPLKLSVK